MEITEHTLGDQEWIPLSPSEELPSDVSTWMVEVQGVGRVFITLADQPGTGGSEDDVVYALLPEIPELTGLAASANDLYHAGFKNLNMTLIPSDGRPSQNIRLNIGSGVVFDTVLQKSTNEPNSPLKPLSYWTRGGSEQQATYDPRDIMVRRGDIGKIQMNFNGGGEVN